MIAIIICTVLAVVQLLIYWRNPYFLKDVKYAFTAIRVAIHMSRIKKKFYSMLDCFLDKVKKHPNKEFIVFEDSSYSYSDADKESNRVAAALLAHAHLQEGDTVALYMNNEPMFVWSLLGVAKLGCTVSLLNSNVRSKSLLHCISCCEPKVLIVGAGKLGKSKNTVLFNAIFQTSFPQSIIAYIAK